MCSNRMSFKKNAMWILSSAKPFLVLSCLLTIEQVGSAPVFDQAFSFEDNWDYGGEADNTPFLNDTHHHFSLPVYSYSKNLEVQGLPNENITENVINRTARKPKSDSFTSKMSCGVCFIGVGLLYREVTLGGSFNEIKEKFVSLCVGFNIETEEVCSGMFETYGPEILPALKNTKLGVSQICSLLFGCGNMAIPSHEWTVEFPEVNKPMTRISKDLPKPGAPFFKVLHISDTHYDPEYEEGSISNCGEPLCCRSYNKPKEGQKVVPAKKWGTYETCDAPRVLIEDMFKHIADEHPDIDYIIWTGDLPPHDIWNQTKQNNLDIIRDTVQMVMEIFPNKPIFPAIGNHESSPAGNFPPPWVKDEAHSISWLYNEIAEQWKKWLPESTDSSVLHGAFYSILLRPGFRLISLNTNYCHTLSWWLAINSTDPANELKWLVNQLQQAENRKEKVHIIGHIAPGSSDCLKVWSQNFYEIVERYEATIVGQFYGHSHADEFEMFYETSEYSKQIALKKQLNWWRVKKSERLLVENVNILKFTGRPTNVAYLGPSVTPYDGYNPSYRIYYVDGDHQDTTREVLDHETWTTDLDQANLFGKPVWAKLYSAKEAYQMKSLKPSEWNQLIEKMVGDEQLFDQFHRYYYRDSSRRPVCDKKCKSKILCNLKSGKSMSEPQLCHELEVEFGM